MAGVDAESQDLTERIRAQRAALVASGEVEPMLPGEGRLVGASPARVDNIARAAAVRGGGSRERRLMGSAKPQDVVEFEYTPEELAAMEAADADEPFEVGDDPFDLEDGPENVREELELDTIPEPDEGTRTAIGIEGVDWTAFDRRFNRLEDAIGGVAEGLGDELEGASKALILIAGATEKEAALHDAILARLDAVIELHEETKAALAAVPPPPAVGIFWRAWRYLFAR